MDQAHVFFTLRNRDARDKQAPATIAPVDRPFAFGYLPLFSAPQACLSDGSHSIALYRFDRAATIPALYFDAPSLTGAGQHVPPHLAKQLSSLKDKLVVRTFLCSSTAFNLSSYSIANQYQYS